jgi:hypothetical protein
MFLLTPPEMLQLGLAVMGFPSERVNRVNYTKRLEWWASEFRTTPQVYAMIFEDLQTTDIEDAYIGDDATEQECKDFLISMHFLACYPKMNTMEQTFNLSAKTLREKIWFYARKVQALKEYKIVWPTAWNPNEDDDAETIFILTVDGIHFSVFEPQHPTYSKNTKYYSHKFNSAGLDYEIGISIFEARVVWINGPFLAGKGDKAVFKAGLLQKMREERDARGPNGQVLGLADQGYNGVAKDLITHNSSHDSEEVREFKSRALSRHENFNRRITSFEVLKQQYRHSLELHPICFEAVVVICQYHLDNGSSLLTLSKANNMNY